MEETVLQAMTETNWNWKIRCFGN